MIQVTAIYQGSEIAYGEGESNIYAIEECIDSVSTMFLNDMENIQLIVKNGGQRFAVDFRHFYEKEKQYF